MPTHSATYRAEPSPAEARLRAGRPDEALEALSGQVRADPSNAATRVFLFQLLAACGQWARARAPRTCSHATPMPCMPHWHMRAPSTRC